MCGPRPRGGATVIATVLSGAARGSESGSRPFSGPVLNGCRGCPHPSDHHDMMCMMSGYGGWAEAVMVVGASPLERKRHPSRSALASPLGGNGHRLRGPQVALLRGNGHPLGAASAPDIAHRQFVFKMWPARVVFAWFARRRAAHAQGSLFRLMGMSVSDWTLRSDRTHPRKAP